MGSLHSVLKQRVITAIILTSFIALGIIWLPEIGVAGLFFMMVLIATWEWSSLAGFQKKLPRVLYTLLCGFIMAGIAGYSSLFSEERSIVIIRDVLGVGCFWWSIALLWVKSYPSSAVLWGSVSVRALMGILTLVPAWIALVYLRYQDNGIALLFILILLVSSADIGAYFTGRAWGKAKLAPAVSPGKSWAGFWGGLFTSTVLIILCWWLAGRDLFSIEVVVFVAVLTVLASVLGDLVESMVKRHSGVKDSGVILPGHGGMMDRLDSITAAAPVFTLCLILVK